eukprot:CAMPEP_0172622236 /NCGR_PEP_ID=MMETSP1068-20121228/119084_1 /TAXON_ID=35684 /ORGANISM="Pseudopedinella elastica, Strain CCMP716" /LENGTH=48 /DNA_ID= /DNA_START= /DNA_END= /DNA_ORIENTATION=
MARPMRGPGARPSAEARALPFTKGGAAQHPSSPCEATARATASYSPAT